MFGRNLDNTRFYTLLKNAEIKNFYADDHFDVEPTDSAKAGQYVKAKWIGEHPRNWELTFTDGSKGSGAFDNATQLVNWLQNNDVGPAGHKSRGQGVKFESLSPSDQATADAATTEDDSNGGSDCPQDSCPEGTLAVSSTDADGVVTCRCVETGDIGEGLGKIGMGLGALALVPVAIAGIVVFGLVKIIKD